MTDNPFERVLDRLRERGWTKHNWGVTAGPNCLNGAAMFAEVDDCCEFQAITSVIAEEQFPERVPEEWHGSYGMAGMFFNNHPDTTFSDVERVLEKAAVKWEEGRVTR